MIKVKYLKAHGTKRKGRVVLMRKSTAEAMIIHGIVKKHGAYKQDNNNQEEE